MTATDTAVETAIVVDVGIDRAFAVFTDGIDSWWPREHINLLWSQEADPARASEFEVRFHAESPTRTRVELEHRHLERHGDGWEQMRDAVGSPDGWNRGLEAFAAATATAVL